MGPGYEDNGRRLIASLVWPERGWPTVEICIDRHGALRPDELRSLLMSRIEPGEANTAHLTTSELFTFVAERNRVS